MDCNADTRGQFAVIFEDVPLVDARQRRVAHSVFVQQGIDEFVHKRQAETPIYFASSPHPKKKIKIN
ncbi:hypothetical protein AYI70_g10551 [Smittium culicis]|uniref:Uncharacterized protein n=1 Tax=Smittium culicis TaxID=133412 RepID=A0A1R1X603_9FUNG|nr:hypothetical protein AYI70_g10551 [Smittium culicis]